MRDSCGRRIVALPIFGLGRKPASNKEAGTRPPERAFSRLHFLPTGSTTKTVVVIRSNGSTPLSLQGEIDPPKRFRMNNLRIETDSLYGAGFDGEGANSAIHFAPFLFAVECDDCATLRNARDYLACAL